MTRWTQGVLVVLACALAMQAGAPEREVVSTALGSASRGPLGDHYLLLVSSVKASTYTPEKLRLFDQSSYDGVVASFVAPNDSGPIPSAEEMTAKMREWRKYTKKDFWPWLYFSRMVTHDPSYKSPSANDPYFLRIAGADLENVSGAQKDFLETWKNCLKAAREVKTPGIVLDPEFYLNYKAYDIAVLAKQARKSTAETVELLRRVGAKMADIADQEYPNAVLWMLATDLGQPSFTVVDHVGYYPSPAYVFLGMLDEIQQKNFSGLRVISGGEVGLGYCSLSAADLQRKIAERAKEFHAALQKYPDILELGGTTILWRDRTLKTDFMTEGVCGKCDADSVEDLQPYLELLLKSYRYNWIYGTYNAGYDPFHPRSAPRFDAMIRKAKQHAYSSGVN